MALSIRKKIWFGTTFLFLLLVMTAAVSIYYTHKLSNLSRDVLKNNYESLAYCHTMQRELDLGLAGAGARERFEQAFRQQEANVTEPGELAATKALHQYYNALQQGQPQQLSAIRHELQRILDLNMQSIANKNHRAGQTSDTALTVIITLAGIVFLLAFTFSLNFPEVVTKPVHHLLEAIRQISGRNYRYRIHISNKDEFGELAAAFNQMAERLEFFEHSNLNKILFEKARAEAVINSLQDASIGIDGQDIVLFANASALQLLHLEAGDVVGKTTAELSVRNDLFRFLLQQETSAPFKIAVDGREHYFMRELMEVASGEGSNKVIVLKDITSFRELDEAKTHFIATISHELKTPLASADLGLKLLADERTGTLSAEQRELLQQLKQDNLRMLKILSELLDMAQAETGKIRLNRHPADPAAIIEQAMATVAHAARERRVELRTVIPSGLPAIIADAEKTTWVLNNLLSNAIRYTGPHTTVTIALVLNAEYVVFSVADQGPGIPDAYRERLFERYFRLPGSTAKGTGLGLAISRDFIEAQGGKIWLESDAGKGAVFYCSLPVAPPHLS